MPKEMIQIGLFDDVFSDFCDEVWCDFRMECMRQDPGPDAVCFKFMHEQSMGTNMLPCGICGSQGNLIGKYETLMNKQQDQCFAFGNSVAERDHAAEVAREGAHA